MNQIKICVKNYLFKSKKNEKKDAKQINLLVRAEEPQMRSFYSNNSLKIQNQRNEQDPGDGDCGGDSNWV